jgi:hypothetical protein
MGRIIDETGNRYGRLTVVRRNPENAYHKGANWICRCECGGERVASGIGLRQGLIKSCGCLIRETRVLRCACGYKGQKTPNWTPDWKCYRCSGLSPLQDPPKMTEDELFEKRAEHWRFYHRSAPTSASNDVMLFLERLEKLREELAEANARRGDLRTALQWANEERDEARAELAGLPAWQKGCEQALGDLADAEEAIARLYTERDEARTEVERLRGVLHVMSLDEYESTTSASDKVHAHARRAREALAATTASDGPSDKAHIASLEDLFLKACIRADKHKKEGADAYRRGAEAMRDAAANALDMAGQGTLCDTRECEHWGRHVRALPIPEDK